MKNDILEWAKQIQSYCKTGLYYVENEYEIDRYNQIMEASVNIISLICDKEPEKISLSLSADDLYITPKVDLRIVVFNDKGEFLFVKEKVDNLWTLPGGFCDVGFSPSEVAVKETWEEAGIEVEPVKLLGVLDKKHYNHPRNIYYLYTIFLLCKKIGGIEKPGMETLAVEYFSLDNLPPLSTPRITKEQLEMMHGFYTGKQTEAFFD
ncbi:NUDIX domain-containing protein [Alkalibaculum sp. M08DMB]|uniref:NUDIX domain-containing protein n=1 Tax=Alkalibaculum sporogenes TaxID=2655001 RepID=A0A6A7KAB5_9FIRM|nr:NUDIX hydrolase [Alkalibaculum sporogenes]MPW26295.1 NUDIX domain-containing protein [Alkalibaculum sporogenes]